MTRHALDLRGPALSAAQRRLLLAYKVEPASAEFTAPFAAHLRGDLDLDAMRRAWRAVVDRHAELRLRIREVQGEPARSYWPVDDFPLTDRVIEPSALTGELAGAVGRVVELIDAHLVHAEVLRLAPREHVLIITAHHCVMDGRSVEVIVRDLLAAYDGAPLAPPGRPYPEYFASEVQPSPSDDVLDAWLREIASGETTDPLGVRPKVRDHDKSGAAVRRTIPDTTWTALRAFARSVRTTPQVLGLAAFAITLGRHTDSSDLVVGGSMDTRSGPFADTVGMFVNPAAVPIHVDEDATAPAFCQSVHQRLLGAYRHRNVPFETIVQRLRVAPDLHRTPVFEVLFNFVARPVDVTVGTGLRVTELDLPELCAKYDVTMVLRDRGDTAELVATYRTARYDRGTIERLTEHTATVLAQLPEAAGAIGDLAMVSDAERAELLAIGRGSAISTTPRRVHEIVAALAAAEPNRPAVTCAGTTLSYGELDQRAEAFATVLAAAGVRERTAVAILAEPSPDTIIAVLATLKAGACYVPLNPQFPVARLSSMIADARPHVLVGAPAWAQRLPDMTVLAVDDAPPALAAAPARQSAELDDAAYVIYTSGTSSEPKGVVVPHTALAASTAARRQVYSPDPAFLLLSPLSFDSSVAGLWGTLTSGGRLVIARTDEIRDPERTLDLIESEHVTATLAVPSLFAALLSAAERRDTGRLRSLRSVILAGEVLPDDLLSRHFALLPDVAVVNEYGPTEATVWSTFRRFDRAEPVDIGRPIPGAAVYLLDSAGRLVPRGVVGELVIGGAGVADGYLGRTESTAASFVADPFAGAPARMYRSGDRARWLATDRLEFLGRRDDMVKVRGHRVELGAVEVACRSCAGVSDVAVVLAPDEDKLVAYLVAEGGFDAAAAKQELGAVLPPVMIPAVMRVVPEIPRTRHGKVDRRALREMITDNGTQDTVTPPAAADSTAVVREAWCAVLKIDTVPTDVNFFDVGGHSLLVLSLQTAIEARTGTRLEVLDLFHATTIEAQAALLGAEALPEVHPAPGELRQARLRNRGRRSAEGVR